MVNNSNSFAKTICPICYEDFNPIVEDLQSISICGHVFHELCLQQWFEYCPGTKKCSCPVCKQSCSANHVSRLYFQSVGDQNAPFLSKKPVNCEEDPILLRGEVQRLEAKVSSLSSILDRQGNGINVLNDELNACNVKLKKEVILRNDAEEQKTSVQRLLHSKSEELDALKLERLRLQDRNMALAKELASVKLASDLNLDEDEALKLATFGNQSNSKDTIDILRKSLVIRNKNYKELMAKCNQLGRGEALSSTQLVKANEKINKLKRRVQELENIVEAKDNEALRTLKASNKNNRKGVILDTVDDSSITPCPNNLPSKDQMNSNQGNVCSTNSVKECKTTKAPNEERHAYFSIDEAASGHSAAVHVLPNPDANRPCQTRYVASALSNVESVSCVNVETRVCEPSGQGEPLHTRTRSCGRSDEESALTAATEKETICFADDVREVQPILNIKRESPSPIPLFKPGEVCFSGGFLGSDGTNRYLGKWCKRGQGKGSNAIQGTVTNSSELIAVGSDGRGGRIKVLRSLSPTSLDGNKNSASGKKCKHVTKASTLQSQGCLQMEHFFGKIGN